MITNGKVVTVAYVLQDARQQVLDRAEAADPFTYLHGAQQIVPGFENALEGMKVGEKKAFVVTPEEGYGELNPELKLSVHRSQFPGDIKIDVGMQFETHTADDQEVLFTVESIQGEQIQINGNHPLAGEELHFDVEVLSIRDATAEEQAHGHAHDGHSHHH